MAKKNKPAKTKPIHGSAVAAQVIDGPPPNEAVPAEANPEPQEGDGIPEMYIGDPFALAGTGIDDEDGNADEDGDRNGDLLDEDPALGVPGCFASVKCGCGQLFKMDLLDDQPKACPVCDARYTHLLVLAAESDPEVVGHIWSELLERNGLMPPRPTEDDAAEGAPAEAAEGIPDAAT